MLVMTADAGDIHHSVTNFYYAAANLIISAIALLVFRIVNPVTYDFGWSEWRSIILLGITAAVSQFLIIIAVTKDKAGRVTGLMFMGIVFGYLTDLMIFDYTFATGELVGAGIIIACSCVTFFEKY
jgi:drug/metabolite transporter (DMT)-like permease